MLAFFIVFCSCLFQSCWYVLIKSSSNTITTLIANVFGCLLYMPLMLLAGKDIYLLKNIWWLIILSGLANGVVFWLVAYIFRLGSDISFITPLRQGFVILSSVIMSFLIGIFVHGKVNITALATVGCFLIALGCFILPILNFHEVKIKDYFNKITALCLLVGFFAWLSMYLDSYSLKSLGAGLSPFRKACVFISPFRLATCVGILPFLWFDKIKLGIDAFNEKVDYKFGLIIGFSISLAYLLVCSAYSLVSDVSYIVAFRLMALPMTIIAGFIFYKEKVYLGKILGSIIILIGIAMTALG
ncbi:MAG: EamA family transporter [Abditibacteriota bacterium]|nr:EamA family transporter [Abditibacteriota bacterium]